MSDPQQPQWDQQYPNPQSPQYGAPQYGFQPGPSYGPPPYPPPNPSYPAPGYGGYGGYGQPFQIRRHGGLATASLVLGIIGFVFGCIPIVNYLAFPIVVLAIIFGVIALKWGKAKAGLILGILGLAATVLWTVAIAGAFNDAHHDIDSYNRCISHATTVRQDNQCSERYLHNN